ncbi:YjbF family lipoprotein [Escherichia coli]|nr:YjbF family lipoprotein [Escherichia coli]
MKRPALILICLLLQACSATTKELGNSLWDSLFGTPGVQLTDDDIQNMPYATARSVFKWDGTDTVKVGSDETPVRVLDEEVSTDQARWHNRYWIDSEGQIRQSEQYLGADYFPVKTTLIKAAKQ